MKQRRCDGCKQLYFHTATFQGPWTIQTIERNTYGFGSIECRDDFIAKLDLQNRALLCRILNIQLVTPASSKCPSP